MPRGMSPCRYCGKLIPSFYKKHHEEHTCREMRRRRGDTLLPEKAKPEPRGLEPWLSGESDSKRMNEK